jgi:hypothetical protein
LRACIHRDECACVVSVSDVLCNSKKKGSPASNLQLFYSLAEHGRAMSNIIEEGARGGEIFGETNVEMGFRSSALHNYFTRG